LQVETSRKLLSRPELLRQRELWRQAGLTTVFTNGVFDLLHRGHLLSLEAAAGFGDRLIVAVNSDCSARSLNKGEGRPFCPENDRALLVAALEAVDVVVIFDEPTPWELLKELRPDVLVKGAGYRLEQVVGREFAGRVELIPLLPEHSTTDLVERILKSLKL